MSNANTGKTYYKDERKMIKKISKSGRTYYTYPKTKKCKDCETLITISSTYCQTCCGAAKQSKNFERVMAGEEYARDMKVL